MPCQFWHHKLVCTKGCGALPWGLLPLPPVLVGLPYADGPNHFAPRVRIALNCFTLALLDSRPFLFPNEQSCATWESVQGLPAGRPARDFSGQVPCVAWWTGFRAGWPGRINEPAPRCNICHMFNVFGTDLSGWSPQPWQ